MPKVRVKLTVGPGGVVQILGVTDTIGRPLSKAECRKAVLEVGSKLGKSMTETLVPALTTEVNQDLHVT